MDEILRRFTGVPLHMTDESGAIVQDAQRQRFDPSTLSGEHAARTVVEVEVIERIDVIDLEAAHFARGGSIDRGLWDGGMPAPWCAVETLLAEVAAHGRVGR